MPSVHADFTHENSCVKKMFAPRTNRLDRGDFSDKTHQTAPKSPGTPRSTPCGRRRSDAFARSYRK